MITKWQEIDLPGVKEIIYSYYWIQEEWMKEKVLEFQILPGIMFKRNTRVFFGHSLNTPSLEEYITTNAYNKEEHETRRSGFDICIVDQDDIAITTLGFPGQVTNAHYDLTLYSYFGDPMTKLLKTIFSERGSGEVPDIPRTPVWFNKINDSYIPIRSDGDGVQVNNTSMVRLRVMSVGEWEENIKSYIRSGKKKFPSDFISGDLEKRKIKLLND